MTTTVFTVKDENGRDCSKCIATKRAMDKRGISYEAREMTDAEREAFKAAGHLSAPVVVTEQETWAGFRPDKILSL
ncbi:glutaredoxin domain-containing protein [Paenarthrobacter sp. TA1.8]|uniref:glutaredoxin domain-containing protein n=1 Tax=Paenarthrobacter sp. TA1.8 TaxID=3400219 RepID=UPI003B42986F